MTWVVAALFLLSLVNYLIKRQFRFKSDFWVLVRKYPDLAQTWFETSDCWRIFYSEPPGGYAGIVSENEWAGPFNIAVRNKDCGEQTRAVVFGRHSDIALSQAAFPQAIALAIGHFPKPRTNAFNLTFVVVTGVWLGVLLLGTSDLDRWVIRDGTVACKNEDEARNIQRASSQSSRRIRIENAVEEKVCLVLLANERVRIGALSADGTRALVQTQRASLPQWIAVNDLRKTNPGWITMPWLAFGSRTSAAPDEAKESQAKENQVHLKRVLSTPRSDATARIDKAGRCIDWEHAYRHGYAETCWDASAKGGSSR